jgi:hypothetical protein
VDQLVRNRESLCSILHCNEEDVPKVARQNASFVREVVGELRDEKLGAEALKLDQQKEVLNRIMSLVTVNSVDQIDRAIEKLQEVNKTQAVGVLTLNEICEIVETPPTRAVSAIQQMSNILAALIEMLSPSADSLIVKEEIVQTVATLQRDLAAVRASNKRQTKLAADLSGPSQHEQTAVDDPITATLEKQAVSIRDLKLELASTTRKNESLRSEAREISEVLQITGSHNDALGAIRQLHDRIRALEADISSHVRVFQGSGPIGSSSDAHDSLKAYEHQIQELQSILGTQAGGLPAVVASIKSVVGQLASQRERNEILLSENRVEKEQVAKVKNQSDDEIIRLQQTLRVREEWLSKIFRCFGTTRSAEIVVQGIEELRSQLNE